MALLQPGARHGQTGSRAHLLRGRDVGAAAPQRLDPLRQLSKQRVVRGVGRRRRHLARLRNQALHRAAHVAAARRGRLLRQEGRTAGQRAGRLGRMQAWMDSSGQARGSCSSQL